MTALVAAIAAGIYFLTSVSWWWGWLIGANVVAALAFFDDKQRAKKKAGASAGDGDVDVANSGKGKGKTKGVSRIPEISLLWVCLIGGTVGGMAVMFWRHHKTNDRKFLFSLVVILIVQAALAGYFLATNVNG